jgi:hypothetical protein
MIPVSMASPPEAYRADVDLDRSSRSSQDAGDRLGDSVSA